MKKIKVLHITQSTIGGTLEYLKMFFKYIDRNKFENQLICPNYGPMRSEIEKMGIKVKVINMQRKISVVNDFKSYLEIRKYIKMYKPDIVHVHSSKAGVLGRIAAYECHVPCVYNPHGWSFSMDVSNKKKKLYAFIEKKCSKYATKIINISENEQKLALKYKIADINKMQVINNGIDIQRYILNDSKKSLNEIAATKENFIIGMVARLTEQKSPITFVKIAEKISKQIENAYFILVGDGELRDKVEKEIEKRNLKDKFLITGWTNDVPRYVTKFDIALLTSKWEGFGLVLAEYMAARKPVIASNVGGIPNVVVDRYNGFLVNDNDVDEYCKKIMYIKENKNVKEKFINNGYETVIKKFDFRRVVNEHEKLYENILI